MTATQHEAQRAGEFDPAVPLRAIIAHPKNPRHRATADVELVDSVRSQGLLQPLVVAPHDNAGPGSHPERYVLIAGHRRLDALKKVKGKTAPTVIRRDLASEAQQVEAMLVENGRRSDLTPIEEAEGYEQLTLLGYTQKAIATAVGRDVKTVRSRLQLLKLQPSTQKKVHTGQFTLDDAAKVAEFADDAEATERIERSLKGDAWNFKHQLQLERRRLAAVRETAALEAKLLDAGASEYVCADDEATYNLRTAARLARTHSSDWGQHHGCLGYVKDTEYGGQIPTIELVCLDPKRHRDQLEAEQRERAEAEERSRAERDQRDAAKAAAADVRVATVLGLVEGQQLPGSVADVVAGLISMQITILGSGRLEVYQDAMGIEAPQRWSYVHPSDVGRGSVDLRLLRDHLDDVTGSRGQLLTRALVSVALAYAEDNLTSTFQRRDYDAIGYLDLLGEAGHDFCDLDNELVRAVNGDTPAKEAS